METIIGPRILTHRWKPLFPGTKLEIAEWIQNLTEASHLDIVYYDGSEREIYFRDASQQILFAPQVESDRSAPDISLAQAIRIPVYQTREIDMTEAIYENGWTENISDIWVDLDLQTDSDNDGNAINDRDTDKVSIKKTLNEISITFGPYEELFTKRIRISAEDNNGNIW